MSGLDGFSMYRPLFVFARGAYVLAERSSIWVSKDAQHWAVADSPVEGNERIEIRDIAAGNSGFIAVGEEWIDADQDGSPEDSRAVVLTSDDGRSWQRVADWRFEHAAMTLVGRSRQGIVAFGHVLGEGATIWTSANGIDWLKATNETGLQVAKGVQVIAESHGRLTAFVALPGPTNDESGPIEVWQTEGRGDWEKVGVLPDQSGAYVHRAAYGGGRWLALGVANTGTWSTRAWSSTDGVRWDHVPSPGGEGVSAMAGSSGGMIAAGHTGSEPGETCGGNEPYVGRTWESLDGDWQALPPTEGAAIAGLVIVEDRIVVGIGQSVTGDGVDFVMWSAALPMSAVQPTPTPSPTPSPSPKSAGCGG